MGDEAKTNFVSLMSEPARSCSVGLLLLLESFSLGAQALIQ